MINIFLQSKKKKELTIPIVFLLVVSHTALQSVVDPHMSILIQ